MFINLKCIPIVISLFLGFWIVGCGHKGGVDDRKWRIEVENWERQGWKVEEELGESGRYETVGYMKSDTASWMTAFWTQKGERFSKEYRQKEKRYLILSFAKANGDAFSVVCSMAK